MSDLSISTQVTEDSTKQASHKIFMRELDWVIFSINHVPMYLENRSFGHSIS